MSDVNHEENSLLLAVALGVAFERNEGVVIHHEGRGYLVALIFNEEHDAWHVTIDQDERLLEYDHLQKMWLHDNEDDQPAYSKVKETLQ